MVEFDSEKVVENNITHSAATRTSDEPEVASDLSKFT